MTDPTAIGSTATDSTETFPVTLEGGSKRTFACALDWPGWCRSGRDETTALEALLAYGPRYARALQRVGMEFQPPSQLAQLNVVERHAGNATTDFGAPAIPAQADSLPLDEAELALLQRLLRACWQAFDAAVEAAADKELRKGPRGGGRNREKILEHVVEGEASYLRRLAGKRLRGTGLNPRERLEPTRQAILEALEQAVREGLPERGPRGGAIWPPRYFVRRVAWHVLDHAWEIEDRIQEPAP